MRGSIKKEEKVSKDGKKVKSYYVVFELGRDPITGKRKQKKKRGFKTSKEAEKYLTEQLNAIDKGTYIEANKMSFGEYLDYWLKNYAEPNTAPKTFEGYDYIINTHIKPLLGQIELYKLQPLHLQEYYTLKMEDGRTDGNGGLSAQSVKHHHRLISKAVRDAVKWQFVIRNVAEAVNPPKPKKQEMKTLEGEQIAVLLNTAKSSQYYPVIFTAIYTGMRRGEVLGLRWEDVDLENKIVYVRQALQAVKGKGLIFKDPKTGKGRSVAMTDRLVQMLRSHKAEQNKRKLLLGESYEDYGLVFCQGNGKPFQPSELTRAYNKLIKKAGVTPVRFHDLRHTHATLMLKQQIHPKIVSERLGHSKVGITLDTYSHVLPNMQKEAADQFDQILKHVE
jgi:integrase